MKILVADLPIAGKYKIIDKASGKVLEQYNGKELSENSFDISFLVVLSVYEKNNYTIVEV